jgi:hypothetical protein
MGGQQTCRIAACRHAQPPAGFFGMGLDRAFADIEQPRHFLGLEMPGNQPQDFFLAPGQRLHPCCFGLHPGLSLTLGPI